MDPYHLLYRGGQFYLIGHSHEREDVRVFRVSRIRGKVGYSSKAEHDFNRPEEFDPRVYATRTDWQLGDPIGRASIWLSDRIDWLALRHFGHAGEVRETDDGVDLRDRVRRPAPDGLVGARPRRAGAHPRAARAGRGGRAARRAACVERHSGDFELRRRKRRAPQPADGGRDGDGEAASRRSARALRAARHARGHPDRRRARGPQARAGGAAASRCRSPSRSCARTSTCSTSSTSAAAATCSTPRCRATRSRSTPSPTATTSPARRGCCRSRRKALVAAIDLIGEHLPEGSLASRAPEDRRRARPGPGRRGPPDHDRQGRRLRDRARRARARSSTAGC